MSTFKALQKAENVLRNGVMDNPRELNRAKVVRSESFSALIDVAEAAFSLRQSILEYVEANPDAPSYPWPALDIALDILCQWQ